MSGHEVELRVAWQQHVSADVRLLDRVVARHRERHRRYHTADHVVWVVRHVLELARTERVDDVGAVVAAAFYHDAIYEPTHPANERASARLATRDLDSLDWPPERCERVAAMIEGTAAHLDPPDLDHAVLFDADLAVLGAEPAAYSEYQHQIRSEFRHLDDGEWMHGRREVLTRFLDRTSIYSTATGRERWERRARANIAAELATLS